MSLYATSNSKNLKINKEQEENKDNLLLEDGNNRGSCCTKNDKDCLIF